MSQYLEFLRYTNNNSAIKADTRGKAIALPEQSYRRAKNDYAMSILDTQTFYDFNDSFKKINRDHLLERVERRHSVELI